MLEHMHEHIVEELRINTRTDTIFVITGLIFNGILVGTNSGLAAGAASGEAGQAIIFGITMVLSILVNAIAITGLYTGRATRKALLQGLLKMYEDADVSQYYHTSLLTNYLRRYVMFISIVALMGVVSFLVPLVVLLTN